MNHILLTLLFLVISLFCKSQIVYKIKDTLVVEDKFDALINRNDTLFKVKYNSDGTATEKHIDNKDGFFNGYLIKESGTKETGAKEFAVNSKGEPMGVYEYTATAGKSKLLKDLNKKKEANTSDIKNSVTFRAYKEQQYGFDSYTKEKEQISYRYPQLNNSYRASYKSVAAFMPDKVEVSKIDKEVRYCDQMGIPLATNANEKTIRIRGPNVGEYPIHALKNPVDSTSKLLGKLNVVSYEPVKIKVYALGLNGKLPINPQNLQEQLNKIYSC